MGLPTSELIWVSKNGKRRKIKDMETKHLVNTIKLVERGDHGTVNTEHEKYHALKAELAFRSKKRKQDKILIQGVDQESCVRTGLMGKSTKFQNNES